jgi:oligopeptide transport system permease protein
MRAAGPPDGVVPRRESAPAHGTPASPVPVAGSAAAGTVPAGVGAHAAIAVSEATGDGVQGSATSGRDAAASVAGEGNAMPAAGALPARRRRVRDVLVRRLLVAVPTLLAVVTASFFLMRLAPGGPFDGDRRLPPAVEANLLRAYQLDRPLVEQYFDYLVMLARLDLGPSFRQKDFTVNELIAAGAPVSFTLGTLALAVAIVFGGALGALAGARAGGACDHAAGVAAMLLLALPPFVVAPLGVLLFAIHLGWLPAGGWRGLSPPHLVLPVLALAGPYVAAIARLTRGAVIETLAAPFVRTARAKGISAVRLYCVHVLPAAATPVVSFLGPATAALLTGSMVVEQVFGLPGIGRYFVQGALARDYTLVMGVVIVYAVVVIAANLLVDLLYARFDPRVRVA